MPKIYKARLIDASVRTATRMRDIGEMARKTLVATFSGTAFTAEREGEELMIYHVGADAIPSGTLGDRRGNSSGMTARKLQAQIEATRLVKDKANAW